MSENCSKKEKKIDIKIEINVIVDSDSLSLLHFNLIFQEIKRV